MSDAFGQWLKAKREERGLSLREASEMCGGVPSNAAISQIETGRILNPSFQHVLLLASAYALDWDDVRHRFAHHNAPLPKPDLCPTCGQVMR